LHRDNGLAAQRRDFFIHPPHFPISDSAYAIDCVGENVVPTKSKISAATLSLSVLLLATAYVNAQTAPPPEDMSPVSGRVHDFVHWLHKITADPSARTGTHHLATPLPRPRPPKLAASAGPSVSAEPPAVTPKPAPTAQRKVPAPLQIPD
jgi:hypothetical protein